MKTVSSLRPPHLLNTQLLSPVLDQRTISRRREADYDLGNPGRPTAVPTLLIAVSDDSGSVIATGGSDPLANRYAEMDRAFSAIATRGSRRELAAVLHFDSPCDADVPPRPLTRRSLRALRRGLSAPTGRHGSSELGPSLRRATSLAQQRAKHKATLVVLSDFALLDADVAAVLAELAAFPGDVHAVLLGGDASEHNFDPSIAVTPVHQGDPPGAVARALFSSLMTHRSIEP